MPSRFSVDWETAAAVADRYTLSVDAPFVYAEILAMLFSFSGFCVKSQKKKNAKNKKNRIICVASILVLILVVMFGSNNIDAKHFLQTGSVSNGYLLNFLLEIFDSLDEQMLQYTVPFFIWTNFDIEEQSIELTSLNFLSNLMLEAAGLELPAYNRFLADVKEFIPAMNSFGYYSKEQGKFVSYDEASGIEEEILQKYQILQYNCIFDEENISEVFFLPTN